MAYSPLVIGEPNKDRNSMKQGQERFCRPATHVKDQILQYSSDKGWLIYPVSSPKIKLYEEYSDKEKRIALDCW
jgi:hypothetical protein